MIKDFEKILVHAKNTQQKVTELDMIHSEHQDMINNKIKKLDKEFQQWMVNYLKNKGIEGDYQQLIFSVKISNVDLDLFTVNNFWVDNSKQLNKNVMNLDVSGSSFDHPEFSENSSLIQRYSDFKVDANMTSFTNNSFFLSSHESIVEEDHESNTDRDLFKEIGDTFKESSGLVSSMLLPKQFSQFSFKNLIGSSSKTKDKGSSENKVVQSSSFFEKLKYVASNKLINVDSQISQQEIENISSKFSLKDQSSQSFRNFNLDQNDKILNNEIFINDIKTSQNDFIDDFNSLKNITSNMKLSSDTYNSKFGPSNSSKLLGSFFSHLLTETISIQESNWVYVYELPFDFNKDEMEKDLRFTLSQFGEIERVLIFRFSDFTKSSLLNEKKIMINPKADRWFLETGSSNESESFSETLQTKFFGRQFEKEIEEDGEVDLNVNQSKQQLTERYNEILTENNHLLKKQQNDNNMKKMNLKVVKKQLTKNKRSFAFVKFKNKEAKEKILDPSLRIFGISTSKNMKFNVENADYKISLKILNVPLSTSLYELVHFLNIHLAQNDLPEIQVDESFRNILTISPSLFITAKNLESALRMSFLINQLEFNGILLSCSFTDGSLRYILDDVREDLDFLKKIDPTHKLESINQEIRTSLDQSNKPLFNSKNSDLKNDLINLFNLSPSNNLKSSQFSDFIFDSQLNPTDLSFQGEDSDLELDNTFDHNTAAF
jgi:hypothetical protein